MALYAPLPKLVTAAKCPPMVTLDTVSVLVKVVVITSPALANVLIALLEVSPETATNGATVSMVTCEAKLALYVFPALSTELTTTAVLDALSPDSTVYFAS